ncbi:hypothetical protein SAMN05216276_105310 [Streptosporangium subroseum]|uniref:Uncharacterized protein n=1 Tax=Streptosporangium subroseum TaxID=106412 RepID=A0A239N854_9ACTN|nr:hypothetical protein [Streptosporangium subroseum]SNT51086.1 hypothetical protein SAMN05216276_105310 [Streptosporangium subroseum]
MTMPEHVTPWHDARYDMPVGRQLERYNELAAKDASARARIELVARGIYDPARHGADDRPALTVGEHIELLALAECIARTVRHPSNVHHALLAGVTWAGIARVVDSDELTVRRGYQLWADDQHDLNRHYPDRGMTADEHAAATARAAEGAGDLC